MRETIEANQLKLMKQRGSDLTIFSPRASFMAHHIGDFKVSEHLGGDLQRAVLSRRAALPGQLHPAAMLPQSPGVDPKTCIPELEKCVEGVRQRRHQPEPRSRPAATGPRRR
jgi:4-oxalmesaconate hydratase